MRIGNPPPGTLSTVNLGSQTSPPVLATITGASILNNAAAFIASDVDRAELFVTNTSTTGDLYACASGSSTTALGTLVGPRCIAGFTTSAALQLNNLSGSTITYTAMQTKWR